MLRFTILMLVDQFQKKVVLDKEEVARSSVQRYTRDMILNAHSVDPRVS